MELLEKPPPAARNGVFVEVVMRINGEGTSVRPPNGTSLEVFHLLDNIFADANAGAELLVGIL